MTVKSICWCCLFRATVAARESDRIEFSLDRCSVARDTLETGMASARKCGFESCGSSQVETMRNGGSYFSSNDPRIHFGLGSCTKVERLTIQWPGGRRQVLENLAVDRYLTVEEPLL